MSEATPETQSESTGASDDWMSVVTRKIQDLRFGSVQITVHDGRVTLVESVEKTRITASPGPKAR